MALSGTHFGKSFIMLGVISAATFVLPALPAFGAGPGTVDVTTAGVVPDGTTMDTATIQKAIDDCSAAGGGTLHFPNGRYLTGTIQIKSNVVLDLADGATILGSTNPADYSNLDPFIDGSGNKLGDALIVALDAKHVGIIGKGTIDGQSPALKKNEKPYNIRPFLLRWVRCSDVTLKDVHLKNPGAWTTHFFQTNGAVIDNVTIRSRNLGMPNNDGVDLDSSTDVKMTNCDIESGDDSLVIKATAAGKPSSNIVASGCKLSSHTNAIKLGTESIGGFLKIQISDCQVTNTDMSGIGLNEVDGADLTDVTVSNVTMDGVAVPIAIRLGARLKTFREGDTAKPEPGKIANVTIDHVTAKNIKYVGILINGVPGYPVRSLTLKDVSLELPGGGTADDTKIQLPEKEKAYPEYDMFGKKFPASAIYARHVDGVTLTNVKTKTLAPDARPATVFIDVRNVTPADFATKPAAQ